MSSKYDLENGRYLMFYKLARAGASIAQVGIDSNGYLIIHTAGVVERKKRGEFMVYIANIDQWVFERIP